MGFIYKITNDINDKIYIGQTTRTIHERWIEHLEWGRYLQKYSDKKSHLYSAMALYGLNHFFIEEVEECDNENLNNREIYWINYYDSYNSGYNLTKGGDNLEHFSISVNAYDLQGKFLYRFNSIKDASLFLVNNNTKKIDYKTARTGISCVINHPDKFKTCGGFQWTKNLDTNDISPISMNGHTEKPICQYTKDGKYITTFPNIREAGKATNTCEQNIRKCVKHQGRKSAGGYIWRYEWDIL